MDWKKIKMGDILQVKKGEYITKKDSNEGIYPVILGGREPAYYIDKYNHIGKAIVISRSGASAGYVSFWNEPIFVTDGFLIEPKDGISYEFLYYSLKSKQQILHSSQKGAAIPHVTPYLISSIDSLLPDEKTQIRLASVLSAYDNLIENNNRRIRLLEQMAENLYKEWFVRFRFPGYEKAEFENGLPKGWKYENLFDVADVSYGFAFKSDLFCNDESLNAVVRIRDIQDNHTDTYTCEVPDDKYLIEENAILVGMDGIFHMCLWNGEKAYLNQRVVKINSKLNNLCNYMLFMSIRPQIKFWEQVIAGTTVAHLGDKHLRKVKVTIPDDKLLVKADRMFSKIMIEKNQLFKQNILLSRQRDLLLPRLMSGKLEVKV